MMQILLQYIGETTIQHVLNLHLLVLYKNHCPLKRTLLTWNNVIPCFMTYQKHSFRCKFCQSLAALSSIIPHCLHIHPQILSISISVNYLICNHVTVKLVLNHFSLIVVWQNRGFFRPNLAMDSIVFFYAQTCSSYSQLHKTTCWLFVSSGQFEIMM